MCERFVKKYRKKRAKMPTPIKKSATLTDEKVSLQEMYSIIDKGVKGGVFKPNKGARMKSRLTLRSTKI